MLVELLAIQISSYMVLLVELLAIQISSCKVFVPTSNARKKLSEE